MSGRLLIVLGLYAAVADADTNQFLQVRSSKVEDERANVSASTVSLATSSRKLSAERMSLEAARAYERRLDDPWPTVTDQPSNEAYFMVNVRMTDVDSWPLPDGCYTSIFQYSRQLQYDLNSDDTADWGTYQNTETQQFLYTGTESLAKHDFKIFLQTKIANVEKFKVSFFGNTDSEHFESNFDFPASKGWDCDGPDCGITIPWSSIPDKAWKPPPGSGTYYYNPIHVSIIPLDASGKMVGDTGLAVFISASSYPACTDEAWCENFDGICCFLKGDDSTDPPWTLPWNWDPKTYDKPQYSNNANACFMRDGESISMPGRASNGIYISTLNNLIKAHPDKHIKIVVHPLTTIDFPLSNYYSNFEEGPNLVEGYDVGDWGSRISITGFGRINGYNTMKLYTEKTFDTNTYNIWARLAWLNGKNLVGAGGSGTGWPAASGFQQFCWANGACNGGGDNMDNDGDSKKYYVDVSNVQFGYGPPIGEAPVNLGDFRPNADEYGAAVIVFDVKYISFSTRADGPAMRNPASYGKALFIHGSDDLLKTTTGIEAPLKVQWTALAVTFFGAFSQYGSLSCPCCFGPTGGFQPEDISYCRNVLVQDMLVPVLYAPEPSKDCYKAPGLFATKWGVACDSNVDFPIDQGLPITVENILYGNVFIPDNGFNWVQVPLVNWIMNSNVAGKPPAKYQLENTAAKFYGVYAETFVNPEYGHGFIEYNWGTGSSAAEVSGFGKLLMDDLWAHIDSEEPTKTPCSNGLGYNNQYVFKWAVCPMKGQVPPGSYLTDLPTAEKCHASDQQGNVWHFEDACKVLGNADPAVTLEHPTATLYGDKPCENGLYCGLSFPWGP